MKMTVAKLQVLVMAQDAEIQKLRRDVGSFETRIDLDVRPPELPNGDYNLAYRQHQLGVGIDSVTTALGQIGGGGASSSAGSGTDLAAVRQFLLAEGGIQMKGGRTGIGTSPVIDPRDGHEMANYPLTIGGQGGAKIAYIGNLDRTDPQRRTAAKPLNDPQVDHVGSSGVDQDGGFRWGIGALYRSLPLPSGKWTAWVPDLFRHISNWGLDSEANLCAQRKAVTPDPDYPKYGIYGADEVVNGVRVKSGQEMYVYLNGRPDLNWPDGVYVIAGKKIFKLRASSGPWYEGDIPADSGP